MTNHNAHLLFLWAGLQAANLALYFYSLNYEYFTAGIYYTTLSLLLASIIHKVTRS
jgi:hypothetical protein